MNELTENKDYIIIIPEEKDQHLNVKLISGEFDGVVYRYGRVSGEEDEASNEFYLSFEYEIVESADIPDLEKNEEFKNHIGDILSTIISSRVGLQEEEETEYNEV